MCVTEASDEFLGLSDWVILGNPHEKVNQEALNHKEGPVDRLYNTRDRIRAL